MLAILILRRIAGKSFESHSKRALFVIKRQYCHAGDRVGAYNIDLQVVTKRTLVAYRKNGSMLRLVEIVAIN